MPTVPIHPEPLEGSAGPRWLLPGVGIIRSAHRPIECRGRACTLHRPSAHHLRTWPLDWDDAAAILLRVCEHGAGHVDPDEGWRYGGSMGGLLCIRSGRSCDGCCF